MHNKVSPGISCDRTKICCNKLLTRVWLLSAVATSTLSTISTGATRNTRAQQRSPRRLIRATLSTANTTLASTCTSGCGGHGQSLTPTTRACPMPSRRGAVPRPMSSPSMGSGAVTSTGTPNLLHMHSSGAMSLAPPKVSGGTGRE